MDNERNEVGAAYVNTSKKTGEKYVKIALTQDLSAGDSLLMFAVKNKKNPKQPDYRLILSTQAKTPVAKGRSSAPVKNTAPVTSNDSGDDGLPFI